MWGGRRDRRPLRFPSKQDTDQLPGAEVDGGLGIERPHALRDVLRFSHEAMASVFEVYVVHPDPRYAAQAARAAFDLTDRLEGELSRFRTNSDITRINHLATGESTRVATSTLECLAIARHVFEVTSGAFDISIGTGLRALELDPEGCAVRATSDGVRIDLGGVGKGYAVDLMAELLEEWGIRVALVHGGFSSVLALDAPAGGDGWPLTLSDPAVSSRVLERLSARQQALGASGIRKRDHIVDPSSGEPVRGRRAAWLVLPRWEAGNNTPGDGRPAAAAAVADALTTACMMLPLDEIQALCERSPGLEAWILLEPAADASEESRLLHFGCSAG